MNFGKNLFQFGLYLQLGVIVVLALMVAFIFIHDLGFVPLLEVGDDLLDPNGEAMNNINFMYDIILTFPLIMDFLFLITFVFGSLSLLIYSYSVKQISRFQYYGIIFFALPTFVYFYDILVSPVRDYMVAFLSQFFVGQFDLVFTTFITNNSLIVMILLIAVALSVNFIDWSKVQDRIFSGNEFDSERTISKNEREEFFN